MFSSNHSGISAISGVRVGFIRKVYILLFISLVSSFGGVKLGFANPEIMQAINAHPYIAMVLFLLATALLIPLQYIPILNLAALLGYTTAFGIFISPIIHYSYQQHPQIVWQAAIMTLITFVTLTLYVLISQQDFSFLGGLLFVGLITIIAGGILAIIAGSVSLHFAVAAAAVLLFAGYILFDTSNLLYHYQSDDYVVATIQLYLDIVGLFLRLLQILLMFNNKSDD